MLWKKESNKKNALYIDLSCTGGQFDQFEKIYNEKFKNVQSKSNPLAVDYRVKGNEEFKAKKWSNAMILYNQSLAIAENESEVMSLAYANRSACFFNLKLYAKCLVDIKLAKKFNYPKHLMHKLEQRERDCLKMIEGGDTAKPFVPELSFTTDEKFPHMADVLHVEHGGALGRCIKTRENIRVGQVVLIENGFVKSLASERYARCNICLSTDTNLVPCTECIAALFCYEKCENNWLHNMECKMTSFEDEGNAIAPNIRSITTALEVFRNVDDLMNFVEGVIKSDPFEIPDSLVTAHSKYRAFLMSLKMMTNIPEFLQSMTIQFTYKTILSSPDVGSFFTSKKQKRFLMHLISHHSNIMSCYFWSAKVAIRPLIASFFDHSCAPNARILPFEGNIAVIAIRPIKKGESVTVSLDCASYNQPNVVRRQYLQSRYGFHCGCERCCLTSTDDNQEIKNDPFYKAAISNSLALDITTKEGILTSKKKCEEFLNKYQNVKWSEEIGYIQHFYSLIWAANLSNAL